MVQRNPAARFMGGAWVFPGGSVDEGDESVAACAAVSSSDPRLLVWRAAALRELVEETGIWVLESGAAVSAERPIGDAVFASALEHDRRLAGDSLRFFANWITPTSLPIRFDTRFFVAVAPGGVDPIVDGRELVDAVWIRPDDALRRADSGTWAVAFPTRRILEYLGSFGSTRQMLDDIASQASIESIEPRLSVVDGTVEVLMPGDPRFDDAAIEEGDPALLDALERIARSGDGTLPEVESA